MSLVTVDELIEKLQALPACQRKLPVVTREECWLVHVDEPVVSLAKEDVPGGALIEHTELGDQRVVII
jgi:hypothetical protein